MAASFSRIFIIIDALDECEECNRCPARFLSAIFTLQAKTAVNLFVTSRHVPNIEQEFIGSTSLEIRASSDDIRRYLQEHVPELQSCVSKNHDLQKIIIDKIIDAVDGM